MKSNSKKLGLCLMIALFLPVFFNIDTDSVQRITSHTIYLKNSAQYSESFIHIDGNWSTTVSTYDWCSGDGSWDNPYTIENVTINASSSPIGSGILIENSVNDYFFVQNCTIYNTAPIDIYGGIKLEKVANGTVSNNNCSYNGRSGILLTSCTNITISNNQVNYNQGLNADNYAALRLVFACFNNTITGNNVSNNFANGIQLRENCVNNSVTGNAVIDNDEFGIDLWTNCNFNNVTNNTVKGSGRSGINMRVSNNANIVDNYVSDNVFAGINSMGSSNNIFNNTAIGNYHGILLFGANNNNVSYNTANQNSNYGIYSLDSNNGNISENTAKNNEQYGIMCYRSDWNNFTENTLDGNTIAGIFGEDSHNNTFNENSIQNNDLGIGLKRSSYNFILDNVLSNNNYCIFEHDCTGNSILNNVCSLQKVRPPIYIDDSEIGIGAQNWTWAYNQGICTGSGQINDPYIIENLRISGFRLLSAIEIKNSDAYFIIRNCSPYYSDSSASEAGIKLTNVTNAQLIQNDCSNNFGNGIFLFEDCYLNSITQNNANNNSQSGINIGDECNNNTISYNIANNNEDEGIYLSSGDIDSCYNNSFTSNTVIDNEYGIRIFGACHYTIISENTVQNNDVGIYLHGSNLNFNYIYDNLIMNNSLGVEISNGCSNNTVYQNYFVANGIHAEDRGSSNNWNSTTIGNYWDNHTGPDTSPQDGIVDVSYTFIEGSAGSIDYLPIAEDGNPQITIIYPFKRDAFGRTAPSFIIEVKDLLVWEMWYTLDGGLNNYSITVNGTIEQSAWTPLRNGRVIIRFYAQDIAGNIRYEEVIIYKNAPRAWQFILAIVIFSSVAGLTVFVELRKIQANKS